MAPQERQASDQETAEPGDAIRDAAAPRDTDPRPALSRRVAYVAATFVLPRLLPSSANIYVVQPLIWLGLGLLCLDLMPDLRRFPSKAVLAVAAGCGAFQVALYALAGLVWGFGYSTYSHAPVTLALNLVYLGSLLWGMENARAFLLRRLEGSPSLAFFAVAGLFSFLSLPFARWQTLGDGGRAAFEGAGGAGLPAVAESCLSTLLCALGGPWASFAYRAVTATSEWAAPVLPKLGWELTALVGTLAPAAAFLAARSLLAEREDAGANQRFKVPAWLIAFGVTIVAVIWLNTGLLGIRPALVSGVSMEPNLVLGDIVVTRTVAPESLRKGDVVRFRSGQVPVLHRIIEIKRTPQGLVFTTQGDNNNLPDAPISTASLEGKVILVVPKVGIVPIKLKTWLSR